jgi:hypothetical protein
MLSNTATYHQASVATIVAVVSSCLENLVAVADRRGDTPGWPLTHKTRDLQGKFKAWVTDTEADSESSPESLRPGSAKGLSFLISRKLLLTSALWPNFVCMIYS